MKTKLLALFLFSLLSCASRAEVYVEARLAYLSVSGTPNVGDVGIVTDSDFDRAAPSIALGYNFTPRFALELRYVSLGELTLQKTAPTFAIFPTNAPTLQVPHYYTYRQETDVVSLALPIRIYERQKVSVRVTPLVQRSEADVSFTERSPNVSVVPPGIIFQQQDTVTRAGGEISAAYQLGKHAAITLSYTFLPVSGFDAHLFGGGLNWQF